MTAGALINQMIPPLQLSDTAGIALSWMEEFRCNQLPVVEKEKFIGFITEDLLRQTDTEIQLHDFKLSGHDAFVRTESHFSEVVKQSEKFNLPLVAVENNEGNYAGVITVSDVLPGILNQNTAFAHGSILVLSMELISYSLSEISRFVEENNAKIISVSVTEDPLDKTKIRLAIKINQSDLTRIISTLERFEYRIVARYDDSRGSDPDRDRFDLLMRYLNI